MYKYLTLVATFGSAFAAQIPKNFFQPKAEWTHFQSSDLTEPSSVTDQKISADHISGAIYFNHLFGPKSGFRLGTGYDGLKMDWSGNPLTSQKLFSLAELSGGLFLFNVDNWDIYFEITAALSTRHTNWSTYALYRGILYTKYNYNNLFNIHAGFSGFYGMRYNKVVPIVGVDFPIGRKFHVHGVFPHDLGLEYKPLSFLSAFLRARLTNIPRRLSPDALRPRGAISYRNVAAEFALKAYYTQIASLTGYLGHTLPGYGYVKAENWDGSGLTYYRFNAAFYYGFSLALAF